jgi:hypothetical protein
MIYYVDLQILGPLDVGVQKWQRAVPASFRIMGVSSDMEEVKIDLRRYFDLAVQDFIAVWGKANGLIAQGLSVPGAVAVGPGGELYVGTADGVVSFDNGTANPLAPDLKFARGLAAYKKWLFVVAKDRVWRIDTGSKKADLFAPPNSFPVSRENQKSPEDLAAVAVDGDSGTVYVSNSTFHGAVYRIDPEGKVTIAFRDQRPGVLPPDTLNPVGVAVDGPFHLLVSARHDGLGRDAVEELYRVKLADGTAEKVADMPAQSLAWDQHGRLYGIRQMGLTSTVAAIPRPGVAPVILRNTPQFGTGIAFDPSSQRLVITDALAGTVVGILPQIPGFEVERPPAKNP